MLGLGRKKESARPPVNLRDVLPPHAGTRFEISAHALSGFVLETIVPVVGAHPYPLDELLMMVSAVCRVQPRKIFEWGTHIGKSARIFYETCRHFDIPCEVHSTDLPPDRPHPEHPHEQRGAMVRGLDGVILHEGDGLDTSLQVGQDLAPGVPVLFFLDGDHEYKSVRRELAAVNEKFSWASLLIHDTFEQTTESNYNIGPFLAVREFSGNHPDYQVIRTSLGLPGMTFLYKPGGRRD